MNKERLTVVLDPEIRKKIKIKAIERNITVSEVVEECIRGVIERDDFEEDAALIKFAQVREKTFKQEESLSHDEVWR